METENLIDNLGKGDDAPNAKFIEWHAASLSVFTPAGLRNVLPQASLQNPQSDVTERVIFHLSPADTDEEYWRVRLAVFTPAQTQAVCEYGRFMQSELAGEHHDDHFSRALKAWGCSQHSLQA